MTCLFAETFAQSGRIKISFVGFECIRETFDDILQSDGKGDEVYFNFGFTLANRQGVMQQSYEKRTPVYGDNTGPFSNRINAGSAVDIFGGAKGGIRAGDNFSCNDIIGEYTMNDGDILTIVPTAWEYDPIADNLNSFTSTLRGFYVSMNQKVAPVMAGLSLLTGDLAGVIYHGTNFGLTKIRAGGDQGELGRPGTRPIGMEKYGDFVPKLVVFNTRSITTIINSNYGHGRGVIAVNYDEPAIGNNRDHGIYNILLKFEFTPTGPAGGNTNGVPPPAPKTNTGGTTVPPPPSNSNGSYVPPPTSGTKTGGSYVPPPPANSNNGSAVPPPVNTKVSEPRQISTPVRPAVLTTAIPVQAAAMGVTGTWVGNFGTGTNYNGAYCSFRLNADGTMQVIGADRSVVASGTFKFENNQLTGTYIKPSGEIFSFNGKMDNNALAGTFGTGTNVSNQGTWRMTKQASVTANLR